MRFQKLIDISIVIVIGILTSPYSYGSLKKHTKVQLQIQADIDFIDEESYQKFSSSAKRSFCNRDIISSCTEGDIEVGYNKKNKYFIAKIFNTKKFSVFKSNIEGGNIFAKEIKKENVCDPIIKYNLHSSNIYIKENEKTHSYSPVFKITKNIYTKKNRYSLIPQNTKVIPKKSYYLSSINKLEKNFSDYPLSSLILISSLKKKLQEIDIWKIKNNPKATFKDFLISMNKIRPIKIETPTGWKDTLVNQKNRRFSWEKNEEAGSTHPLLKLWYPFVVKTKSGNKKDKIMEYTINVETEKTNKKLIYCQSLND